MFNQYDATFATMIDPYPADVDQTPVPTRPVYGPDPDFNPVESRWAEADA